MHERVIVVTLSVCPSVSHVSILEKPPFFRVEKLRQYNLGDDLSPLNVAPILEKKRVELRP